MATQAPVKTANGHVSPPRGRGRPKGSTNLSAEERRLQQKTREIDYTRWDNKFNNPLDFYTYLVGYPDKTGLMGSLYRLQPKIDVTLIGQEEFSIHKTIDENEMQSDWVGENFGRGKYMLVLNDSNRPHGQKECATTFFDLATYPKPPVYDPRTLVLTEQKNLDEINRQVNLGVMIRDKDGRPRFRTQEDGPSHTHAAPPPQQRSSGDFIGDELVKGLVAKALGGLGGIDPTTQMANAIEIAKLMQRAPAEPHLNAEQLTDTIVQRIEQRMTHRSETGDIFENYERIETFMKKFSAPGSVAVAGVDPNAGTLGMIKGIVTELISAAPTVIGGLMQLQNLRNQQPRRPQPRRMAPPQSGQVDGPPPQPQALMTPAERILEIAKMGFENMQRGVTGRDFASYVYFFHPGGDEMFETLCEQGGAQAVLGLVSMSPELSKFVTPASRPQVENFLDEFLAFDPGGPLEPVAENSAAHA